MIQRRPVKVIVDKKTPGGKKQSGNQQHNGSGGGDKVYSYSVAEAILKASECITDNVIHAAAKYHS